jgi:hypothetical protein
MTYKWHEAYRIALLETDWSKMEERIRAAETAISARRNELSLDHGATPDEVQAIQDALTSLNSLRRDVASWSKRALGQANPGPEQRSF